MAPKVKYGIRAHLRDSPGGGSVKGACKLGIVWELQTVVADMQSMRAKSKLHLSNSKKISRCGIDETYCNRICDNYDRVFELTRDRWISR